MSHEWDAAMVLALYERTQVRSWRWWRRLQWYGVFAVGVAGVCGGGYGFYELLMAPQDRIPAVIVVCVMTLCVISLRMVHRRRRRSATVLFPLTLNGMPQHAETLVQAAHVSRAQRLGRWALHRSDRLAWMVLALVLMTAAAIVVVCSAVATYDALWSGFDVYDVVYVLGLVGPIVSLRNGLQNWQRRRAQDKQRAQALSESVRNALTALNMSIEQVRSWGASIGFVTTSATSSVAATVIMSVVVSATLTGMTTVGARVASQSIATMGRYVPGISGDPQAEQALQLRTHIIDACFDDVMNGGQGVVFDATCVDVIQQVDDTCARFDGQRIALACMEAVSTVVPEVRPFIDP